MSTIVTKATFDEEIEAWDSGPHTMYCVYEGVSDFCHFYVKTHSGKWFMDFQGSCERVTALYGADKGDRVDGEERAEVMNFHANRRTPDADLIQSLLDALGKYDRKWMNFQDERDAFDEIVTTALSLALDRGYKPKEK